MTQKKAFVYLPMPCGGFAQASKNIFFIIGRSLKLARLLQQKKLFFSLRKTSAAIRKAHEDETLTPEIVAAIAKKLNVRTEEVLHMSQRLKKDYSLNTPLHSNDESQTEWIEWLADERDNQEIHVIQKDEMSKRRVLFNNAMKCLSDRERKIIHMRRLDEPPLTLDEVSEAIGISRERVRQIENAAFSKLQKQIRLLITPHPHNV